MIDQRTRREKSPFTPEQDAIIAKLEARLAAGMTVTRLHVATGISERTIERLVTRNRGYSRMDDHETESAFADLAEWLASEDEAARALAETPTYQRIYQLITYAHKSRQMVAITGDVGIGKTEAAKAYATAHPMTNGQPGALYVRFSEGESRATAALEKVRQTMRGARATVMGGKPMTAIEDAVRPGDCIILDECNFLGDAIDIARCLHDDLDIPVVLIGNPEFKRTVWDKNDSFAALASRALRFDFPSTTAEDVDAWLAWQGLSGADLRKAAVRIAARPGSGGGLRTLAKMIDITKELSGVPTGPSLLSFAQQSGRL